MNLQVSILNIVSTYLVKENLIAFIRQHQNGEIQFELIDITCFILDGRIIRLNFHLEITVDRNEGEEGENRKRYLFEVESTNFDCNYLEYH